MATHNMPCAEPYYSLLKSGAKPVEGRKGSPTWAGIKAGDTIVFSNGKGDTFRATVTGVAHYKGPDSLRRYLETETLARALPGVKTLEEGVQTYLKPPISWTAEEVALYGVLAIQLRVA